MLVKTFFSVSKIEKSQYNVNSKQDLGVGGGGGGVGAYNCLFL